MRRILSSFREGLSWGQLSPAEAPQKGPLPSHRPLNCGYWLTLPDLQGKFLGPPQVSRTEEWTRPP